MRKTISMLIVIILFGLPACNARKGHAPTATPPILTTIRASTRTGSVDSNATITPTGTLLPSPTATPQPNPHLPGYYSHPGAGFSFSYPASWQIQQETKDFVTLSDSSTVFVFVASSQAEMEAQDIKKLADEFAKAAYPNAATNVQKGEDITLADGVKAQSVYLTTSLGEKQMATLIAYLHSGQRGYLFTVITDPVALQARQQTLERIFESVHFFTPQLYDLDRKNTIVLMSIEPKAKELDPALTTGPAGGFTGLIYSGLVRLSPHLQILPELAEKWSISPDGTIYTFTLRQGLKFSSGEPLTAEDVKGSWERAADPETKSSTASTYLGDILGVKEKLAGEADDISGLKVVDERTLEVRLDGPKPYFLAKLTYPTAFVINTQRAKTLPETWVFEPDASGPYGLKENRPGEAFIFERNERYYRPLAIRTLVYLFPSDTSALSLYEQDILDILPLEGADAHRARKEDDPLHAMWQSTTSLCTSMINIDNQQPPMDDIHVRNAFAMAVNRRLLAERLTEGIDIPAETILPPALPGYSQNLAVPHFNPQAARAELRASGYAGNLPPVTLSAAGLRGDSRQDVNALIEMWMKELGVQVNVEYIDPTRFGEMIRERHGQMVLSGWCADYPDPQNFLDILFHSESGFNNTRYANLGVDALLEIARTELDPALRMQIYQKAEALLLQDAAAIPLLHPVRDVVVQPRIKGFKITPIDVPIFQYLRIDPSRE